MVDFNKKFHNSNKFSSYEILKPTKLLDVSQSNWNFCGIYKITNIINKHCYVGQALNIRKRLIDHVSAFVRGDKKVLYDAIRKYGIENFIAQPLIIINDYDCSNSELKLLLNSQEIFFIQLFDSYQDGYNSTPGGDSGRLGFKHSKETIDKIKKSHKNYIPKAALNAQKKVFGYDLIDKKYLYANSIAEMARITGADYRSIGQICNNKNYINGGRFIVKRRFLFSLDKSDLDNRINFFKNKNNGRF